MLGRPASLVTPCESSMNRTVRSWRLLPAALCAALLACASSATAQQVTDPSAHLGRPLAADFQLADWGEVSGYYERLSEESPNVQLERVGRTTEGREFLLAVVSSAENLARLDELKQHAATIADPRGASAADLERALEGGRPFLMVSNAMHSTEAAAPQFGMELVHTLATSEEEPWTSARRELVVLVLPCTNPDGLDRVVDWYRSTVGSPHEAARLPQLYQRYAGHDNNRDWFMLALDETRLVTRLLYRDWHPQVYWDVHQQGQRGERLFVPPFRDPLNPNLDPVVIAGIDLLGTRALLDLTREGLRGVATGVTFDMWWNGGNRNVPVRHNIIGLLTEAASVDLASPVFLRPDEVRGPNSTNLPSNTHPAPWPGGWWRLRDIVDYEMAFARSLVRSLSVEPRTWLGSALEVSRRAIAEGREGTPRAWVLPADAPDPDAVRRLVDTLLLGGVELFVARAEVRADGRTWPAGSIVIRRDQPYGDHVKDLFEVQRYPAGSAPYDVAGWTLPLLLGVPRVEVVGELEAELAPALGVDEALAGFVALDDGAPMSVARGDAWRRAFAELAAGRPVGCPGGTLEIAPDGSKVIERLPRVGLYAPWSGSMSEGWMRWVFERFGLEYVTVRNETLRSGRLEDLLDVLVLPDVSGRALDRGLAPGSSLDALTGGLDPEGAIAIEEFVRGGGRLVAIEDAAAWAIELFDLPLVDVTRGEESGGFSCPGSVLRGVAEDGGLTWDLPASVALFFSRSFAWRVDGDAEHEGELQTLLRYAPTRVLLSGWAREPERIAGKAAWVRAEHGQGAVHLFGFSPHYRSWSQGTFQLLFRAILLDVRD